MSLESNNKEIRRRFWAEQFTDTDAAVERYLTPDVIDHDAAPGQPAGAEGWRWLFNRIKGGFPDARVTPADMIAEGDRVVTRWVFEGTNTADYQGIAATGRRVRREGIQIERMENGRIAESWNHTSEPRLHSELTGADS
jgi:predicted ester cyclase